MAKVADKTLLLGIDIGGTKVKLVLMRRAKVLAEDKYLLKSFKTSRQFLATLLAHIELLLQGYPRSQVRGIGIGLPAVLDANRRRVILPPNLSIIKNINFKKVIRTKFNLPVRLENDANAMALGEMMFGAGKGKQSLVMLSLGTGVGGGIVYRQDNKLKLLTGHDGAAAEIGHMIINFQGVEGRPQRRGELEQYASAKFIKRRSSKHPLKLQEAALAGKKGAVKIYEELGYYLGIGLANIINIVNPEVIVLGGGLSAAYKVFSKAAKKSMKANILAPTAMDTVVLQSKLKDRGGAMGAAALWLN
ncbi:MAG: ROK family protein [Candidatus Komeilibacteria bacterium]